MPYQPNPHSLTHPEKTAVLLVNLGTPEAPTQKHCAPTEQFLSDRAWWKCPGPSGG